MRKSAKATARDAMRAVAAPPQNDRDAADRLSALEKSLVVLEAIASYPRPVGLPDLTDELGLPRQTIHRVLQQLCEAGLLVRDASRDRYAIGPRLNRLSLAALSTRNQAAPARAILADVVAKVGETCNIGVLDGLDLVYLDRIEAEWSLRVHLTAGSRVPAYCTSGGKVLLAHLDSALAAALINAAPLGQFTSNTVTSPDALARELAAVRAQGFAINDEEYTVGIVGAAVPILDARGRALGALAMHGPSPRLSLDKARAQIPALRAAARRLAKVWEL